MQVHVKRRYYDGLRNDWVTLHGVYTAPIRSHEERPGNAVVSVHSHAVDLVGTLPPGGTAVYLVTETGTIGRTVVGAYASKELALRAHPGARAEARTLNEDVDEPNAPEPSRIKTFVFPEPKPFNL